MNYKSNMKIGIICSLDEFANSIIASEIKKFLERKGHTILLINMYPNKKENPSIINKLFNIYYKLPYSIKQYFVILQFIIRAYLIMKKVNSEKFDVLISETELDSYILKCSYTCPFYFRCYSQGLWRYSIYFDLSRSIIIQIQKPNL